MYPKTLEEVYEKRGNRLLKVIYSLIYFLFLLYILIWSLDDGLNIDVIEFLVGLIIFFELLKRSFYYVAAGTIEPLKDNKEYLQKYS